MATCLSSLMIPGSAVTLPRMGGLPGTLLVTGVLLPTPRTLGVMYF